MNNNMIKDLVSIITPCYNTGNLLPRLLDSILAQDYPFVEMYAINDGSKDETENIIKQYIPVFEAKGYSLNYVYQENSGQSVAINNGLKLVKGEFLVWPDSDDFYSSSTALSSMVDILKNSDDSVSMVRCLAEVIEEKTLAVVRKYSYTQQTEWFEDCLFAKNNFWFYPGDYMVKMKDLDIRIREREIYTEKNAGQNWQLLLPLLYKKKCITINEYHYKILERAASHSRGQYKTFEEIIIKNKSYENTIIATLEKMSFLPDEEKNQYINQIREKYLLIQFRLAVIYGKTNIAKKLEETLKNTYNVHISLTNKLRLFLFRCKRLLKMVYDRNY